MILPVYIGYDEGEPKSYAVTRYSLERHSSMPLYVRPLNQETLRTAGLYERTSHRDGVARIDDRDGKPFSTDFSFSRFLVPALNLYEGWALFCDGDFLYREDVAKLAALKNDKYAVMVVKHRHIPSEETKMDGRPQTKYFRKNWSSLVLWNCAHPANRNITPHVVNTSSGQYLHAFSWLRDSEIGELPRAWNHLVGTDEGEAKAMHFTRGTPEFEQYRLGPEAGLWWNEFLLFTQQARAA